MRADVYVDGRVTIERRGVGHPGTVETHVLVSRRAVQIILTVAEQHGVFRIPTSVQNGQFGADIPVLSLSMFTTHGERSVHATGTETHHVAGVGAFFPIWSLLYAVAGYPPQFRSPQ